MSIEWDIDSYKTEFETDEHWELRKRFMVAHRDKFPEDELVCLAQVFTNIEFMGCRYPEQTMKRVAYLAKGVVEEFREKKKNCLKRTFVAASDAASAKVKGLIAQPEGKPKSDQDQPNDKLISDQPNKDKLMSDQPNDDKLMSDQPNDDRLMLDQPKTKKKKIDKSKSKSSNGKPLKKKKIKKKSKPKSRSDAAYTRRRKSEPESKSDAIDTTKMESEPESKSDAVDTPSWSTISESAQSLLKKIHTRKSVLDNFIVFYFEKKENPLAILSKSAAVNSCQMSWCHEDSSSSGAKIAKLYFNRELIAEAEGDTLKQSRKQAAKCALDKLKHNCFGVRLNASYQAFAVCNRDFVVRSENNVSNVLAENNIGCKLMILMGWKGGGLGREEQGIIEPITSNMLPSREGLGVKPDLIGFKKRAEIFLRDWVKNDPNDDLLFTPDFTAEERRELHLLAHAYSLKSKSQGNKNNRRLLISRTQHPLQILENLINAGGSTGKFDLVYPGKLSSSSTGNN